MFFRPKSIFYNFKNAQKSIFDLGKVLKLPKKNAISCNFEYFAGILKFYLIFHGKYAKKTFREIHLFDFTCFLPGLFLNFLACCCETALLP